MSKEFNGIFPVIVSGLAQKITTEQSLDEETVLRRLYASKLYALLEQEDTGVWQFSVSYLYEKYKEEIETGQITFPD